MAQETRSVKVKLDGRDELDIELTLEDLNIVMANLKAVGCHDFLKKIELYRTLLTGNLNSVPVPKEKDHASLLIKEALLKLKNEWNLPYQDVELCHCRAVPLKDVMDAIYIGAHDPAAVRRITSASSACGTCRPDIEKLLKYLL